MKIVVLSLVAASVLSCSYVEAASATYAADEADFPNPERGWYGFTELKPVYRSNSNVWASESLFSDYASRGYRLIKHISLIPTSTEVIPQSYLDSLQAEADLLRAHGLKGIYRFTYNWNHDIGDKDASLEIIQAHLGQLKPFLTRNGDAIFALEMGFIGYWGEMHDSTSGHVTPNTVGLTKSGKSAVLAALDALPKDRALLLRYPKVIFADPEEYGSFGFPPLTEETAYSGSPQSRMGGWQSCFGGGALMMTDKRNQYPTRWAAETRYVPMASHCDIFQTQTFDPQLWMEEAALFHYVALSNPKDERNLFAPVYERWIETGAYFTIARKLGYRFRLQSASADDRVAPGEKLRLQIRVANDGWSRPVNPRVLEVALRNKADGKQTIHPITPPKDFRLWFPEAGAEATLKFDLAIPAQHPEGEFDILLALPDPAPSLHDRPDYSIRLANKDMWEAATGLNHLKLLVKVTAAKP